MVDLKGEITEEKAELNIPLISGKNNDDKFFIIARKRVAKFEPKLLANSKAFLKGNVNTSNIVEPIFNIPFRINDPIEDPVFDNQSNTMLNGVINV